MTVFVAVVAGFLAARLLWLLLRGALSEPAFLRDNYRGHSLPTAGGLLLLLGYVLVEAGRAVAGAAGAGDAGESGARLAVGVAVLGFGSLGLLDDLAGRGDARGFRGHAVALARGRLTTGGVKLLGGAAVAIVVVAPSAGRSAPRLLVGAALVALSANLGNLFDRSPGRALKVGLAAFLALAVGTLAAAVLVPVAVVAGGAAAMLLDDLHERLMLGDTGANALGAVLGLGVVLSCSFRTCAVTLAVVAGLNLASELVSFSRVIDAVPPLRALDRAGRRHP
jgi:UDP-N-acetylmuramyl pentapeptide phosphotransferase/UDP-N-acetylglucosamine-1-phosphate transferase